MVEPKDLWQTVVKLHQAKGRSRTDALNLVIVEWLLKGDAEPLIESVLADEIVDPVLRIVAIMLSGMMPFEYYLALHRWPGQLGARKKPGRLWRDCFIALEYEKLRKQIGSEEAFEKTAAQFGIGVSAVRTAVTVMRRMGVGSR